MKPGWVLIPCRHAHALISARMDGPLDGGDRLRLWLHLRLCALCKHIDRQMAFMREAMRRIGP
jgi:hypothetical protein